MNPPCPHQNAESSSNSENLLNYQLASLYQGVCLAGKSADVDKLPEGPMETLEKGCRLWKTMRPGDYPCETNLHTLKVCDIFESNIVKNIIAIVKSTVNSLSNRNRQMTLSSILTHVYNTNSQLRGQIYFA